MAQLLPFRSQYPSTTWSSASTFCSLHLYLHCLRHAHTLHKILHLAHPRTFPFGDWAYRNSFMMVLPSTVLLWSMTTLARHRVPSIRHHTACACQWRHDGVESLEGWQNQMVLLQNSIVTSVGGAQPRSSGMRLAGVDCVSLFVRKSSYSFFSYPGRRPVMITRHNFCGIGHHQHASYESTLSLFRLRRHRIYNIRNKGQVYRA